MLAKRIIPCLDINKGRVVKGVHFVNLRDAGDPIENALFYEKEGADELVFLDITASYEKRKTTLDLVKKVAECVFMPFTVGGGISSAADIRELLLAGADKVSINTIAVKNPKLITEASNIFGAQCIVVAIDAKAVHSPQCAKRSEASPKGAAVHSKNKKLSTMDYRLSIKKWEVYINGGRTATGLDAVSWAKEAEKLGAGEILLTSMDYDGTKDGYDVELTKAISAAVKIPVIASGGAGKIEDFYEVFVKTAATAALAASIFHYREIKIKNIKQYLKKKGIEVRI
ncbi:MAG: imidazole glycerol phosphate synthase subunit HisF [Candidatus Omnitrophica bacterium]|jgi:cyclase|nr:imidazole glycerol phosphate synthase subunit HisF [Candidatus Omnitrophota bacterium]